MCTENTRTFTYTFERKRKRERKECKIRNDIFLQNLVDENAKKFQKLTIRLRSVRRVKKSSSSKKRSCKCEEKTTILVGVPTEKSVEGVRRNVDAWKNSFVKIFVRHFFVRQRPKKRQEKRVSRKAQVRRG